MSRTSMNISLPAPLKTWVERQVEERGYSTASEFVRDVLRRLHDSEAHSELDKRLLAAMDSGTSREMTDRDWLTIRTAGLKMAKARRNK